MNKNNVEMIMPMPAVSSPQDNVIESDSHTLISNFFPAEMIPVEGESGPIPDIYEQVPEYSVHKLFLNEFDDESKHGLHKIINRLQEANPNDTLELHISGHGGYVSEGIILFNLINSMYKSRSTGYLNYGYSMNALAFLFCSERVVFEHSEIMFHTYSAGFGGKRDDILSQIKHTDKHLQTFFHKTLSPFFSDSEIEAMGASKDYWLNSFEMLERGIATGIIIEGEYYTRDDFYKKYNKKGKIKKSYLKKQEKEVSKLQAQIVASES